MSQEKVVPLIFDTYLAVIKNSAGSNMFRNFYAEVDGVKKDIMNDGEYSCAFFASSVLAILGLIGRPRATVNSAVKELEDAGWQKIEKPRVGAVLVWEGADIDGNGVHKHLGFYTGDDTAVSNNYKTGQPGEHHWTFGEEGGVPTRKVELIFWNPKFN